MLGAFNKNKAVGVFIGFKKVSEFDSKTLKAYELLLFTKPGLPLISRFMIIESLFHNFIQWCSEMKVKIIKVGAMAHNSFSKYLEFRGFIKEEIFFRKVIS